MICKPSSFPPIYFSHLEITLLNIVRFRMSRLGFLERGLVVLILEIPKAGQALKSQEATSVTHKFEIEMSRAQKS